MELARLKYSDGISIAIERVDGVSALVTFASGEHAVSAYAHDTLQLIDSAGLNTTANELRVKLDTVSIERNRLMLWLVAAGCSELQVQRIADGKAIESDDMSPREIGVGLELSEARRQLEESRELFKRAQELIAKHEKLADDQNAQLAAAHQTIAQLRQADTVRPAAHDSDTPHCATCECDKGW